MASTYAALQEEKDGKGYAIKVKELGGEEMEFQMDMEDSVMDLKKLIEAKKPAAVLNRQRLIWMGREINDGKAKLGVVFKDAQNANIAIHLVIRKGDATNRPVPSSGAAAPIAMAQPSRPMQTVKCPFCRITVQFPEGSQMIRCSNCGGISRIQRPESRQRKCPQRGCNVTLAYRTNMQYVRCPQCVSTIETARWRIVQAGDAKRN